MFIELFRENGKLSSPFDSWAEIGEIRMPFYHCAPLRLGAGSIIEPGNWGRIKRSFEQLPTQNYREIAYEFGRLALNPAAPSRLDCVFCCETLAEANNYLAQNAPASVIHEVVPTNPHAVIFRTSWDFVGNVNPNIVTPFADLENGIRSYWAGNPVQHVEVLIGGSVRVL
ncbi:hypothetical protein [Brucella pseudogrignonensis]|uniref:hypothetical protein n=1 Tax=Brucella pseudogrignonensis TaxID=419475 RepID=UPI0012ED773E|nr:hypothetical protein [Brucella pseudogrignonensis]